MKSSIKNRFFVSILAFFIGMQPSGACCNVLDDVSFGTGYVFGTAVGACACLGANMLLKGMGKFSFNMSDSEQAKSSLSDMVLKDYVGAIPQEVADLITQLKNAQEYEKMGVKVTKGFIFFGAPGSGKTHLARSIAAEINCPFFAVNATDFKQPHVGEAKNEIKKFFEQARDGARKHPSKVAIVFIDELDAVGTRAGNRLEGGIDETINTLLSEMDGFNQHKDVHVVVIAATNILENIDPAIKRAGRFDHKIYIPYPDLQGRILFIQTFLNKYPSESNVSCTELAKKTEGMSPADLVLLFETAGRIAIRSKKNKRDVACFDEALKHIKRNRA
jgi:cell division protease FtsH